MKLIQELWRDEAGLVLSAEAVTIGTVGVLGAIVGLNAAGTAVNSELKEMAFAIRSLDQSYGYVGHQGRGAWTAGSYYRQPDVQQSLADLSDGPTDAEGVQQQIEMQRQQLDAKRKAKPAVSAQPPVYIVPTPEPLPNQIPVQEPKSPTLKPDADSAKVEPSTP
jgi:hypothetical protein